MGVLIAICAALFAGPALSQTASPCNWQARADNIAEPWEDNTATFANGAVRLALLDTIEPAAAAFYMLILHPPYDELGARTCTLVGRDSGLGYGAISFDDLQVAYDPARGLVFDVPAVIYLPEDNFQNSTLLQITVSQASGAVTVTQQLGGE